jgi:hypothetical protein
MRIVRNDEVAGSTPVSSTKTPINTHFSTSHLAMDASGFTSGFYRKVEAQRRASVRSPIIVALWTTWWQDDLPCRFSAADAEKNCDFLADTLGRDRLQRAVGPNSQYPLVREWMTNGANAFL